jgi:hypothetical protein
MFDGLFAGGGLPFARWETSPPSMYRKSPRTATVSMSARRSLRPIWCTKLTTRETAADKIRRVGRIRELTVSEARPSRQYRQQGSVWCEVPHRG